MLLRYDHDCGVCSRSVAWLQQRTPTLTFEPLQEHSDSVVLVRDDGVELREASAIGAALQAGSGVWRQAGLLIAHPAVLPLSNHVYRLVARNRQRISRIAGWESCTLPPR